MSSFVGKNTIFAVFMKLSQFFSGFVLREAGKSAAAAGRGFAPEDGGFIFFEGFFKKSLAKRGKPCYIIMCAAEARYCLRVMSLVCLVKTSFQLVL